MTGHVYRRCPKPLAKACESGRCEHRWAFTFSAGTDLETGRRRQFTGGGFSTRKDAERACRTAIAEAEAGTLATKRQRRAAQRSALEAAAAEPTLVAYLPAWLQRRTRLRPNTRDAYQTNIDMHIVPRIGDVKLAELTPRQVRDMLEDLARPNDKGKVRTKATIARVRATLSAALADAVLDGIIDRNPALRIPLPESAPDGGRSIEVYSPEQLARFLTVLEQDRIGALYYVDAFTGMRRSELVGLQWGTTNICPDCGGPTSAVDLDAGRVTVRHAITQRGGVLRHGKPKTKKGERVVALDARTVDVLRRHKAAQAAERLAWGPAWTDHGLVFTREDGTALRPDYVTRHFHDLADVAGVPRIRLHDLRHTHASHALAAGVPTKVVSERLGHSSTAITENIYTHVVPKVAADAAELIAALVAAVPLANPLATGGDS